MTRIEYCLRCGRETTGTSMTYLLKDERIQPVHKGCVTVADNMFNLADAAKKYLHPSSPVLKGGQTDEEKTD